jgi:5-methylcytosine-specific restriction endonuclease McrA
MRGTNVARIDDVESVESKWMQAHRMLSRLARERASADAEEGRWLLAAARSAAHVHLGFGSFAEYIERLFGYSARSTQDKLRVAEALEALPSLAQALEDGAISWSAVRELTRVAVRETEDEWLRFAQGKTIRQLEDALAGTNPGDAPDSLRDPSKRRHVLRFEVSAETYALMREALRQLRRSSDTRLDDDAALLTMARAVLGGPSDEGRSSYQISLSICSTCGQGAQLANGERVPVEREILELAQCDGQHIGSVPPPANDHPSPIPETPHDAHVGTNRETPSAPPFTRAKQTIPPAQRRAVLQRDQRRCRVPGCKNATYLDLHHIQPRAEGGRNQPENLVTLCGAHHRAAHRGELVLEGNGAADIRFRHSDGSSYGEVVSPSALAAQNKVFAALRGLGFREAEVRAVLADLRSDVALRDANPECLLRKALARLTRPAPNERDG